MGAEVAMTPMSTRCAVLARALDEPLAGTAPGAARWLCLEQSGPWPQNVAEHRDAAVRTLARRAADAGWRLLLIRRPGRRIDAGTNDHPSASASDVGWNGEPAASATGTDQHVTGSSRPGLPAPAPVRVFLVDTGPERPLITALTATPAELVDLALPTGTDALPGHPVAEPLLLVCTHGRQDRCCALDGRALISAIAAGCPELTSQVWESSHLGGHRFAPTALVLPTGYLYGRLDPATAVDVLKATSHGEMEPMLCRGRSTWSPAGQVAELAVRGVTGLREAAALRVEPRDDDAEVLVRATDGRCWLVSVEQADRAGTRPLSCRADPSPIDVLRAVTVRALAPVR